MSGGLDYAVNSVDSYLRKADFQEALLSRIHARRGQALALAAREVDQLALRLQTMLETASGGTL